MEEEKVDMSMISDKDGTPIDVIKKERALWEASGKFFEKLKSGEVANHHQVIGSIETVKKSSEKGGIER